MALIHLNGRLIEASAARIDPADRGLLLADGLFETLRATGGRPFALDAHLDRLADGARVLGLTLPPRAAIEVAVSETLAASGRPDAILRITVTRGPGPRGLATGPASMPTWMVSAAGTSGETPASWTARVVSVRRNEHSPTSRLKSLAYLDGVLALREAEGADEALMRNTAGRLACGSRTNLFAVLGDGLVTPPVAEGVLPGVTRRLVLELAAAARLPAREAPFGADDLRAAREVFVTNSVIGVVPLRRVDDRALEPGPVAAALRTAYQARVQPDAEPRAR